MKTVTSSQAGQEGENTGGGCFQSNGHILENRNMNQDSEKGIFTKVKIQVRLSDLIKDKDINFGQQVLPQRDEGNDGGATNSFDYCQLNSVPKIKIDDVTGPEFENGQDDARDTNSSRRRQSAGSSVPAASKESSREERPVVRKCLSLRETRQGRSRGVEENKIVR